MVNAFGDSDRPCAKRTGPESAIIEKRKIRRFIFSRAPLIMSPLQGSELPRLGANQGRRFRFAPGYFISRLQREKHAGAAVWAILFTSAASTKTHLSSAFLPAFKLSKFRIALKTT